MCRSFSKKRFPKISIDFRTFPIQYSGLTGQKADNHIKKFLEYGLPKAGVVGFSEKGY